MKESKSFPHKKLQTQSVLPKSSECAIVHIVATFYNLAINIVVCTGRGGGEEENGSHIESNRAERIKEQIY